MHTYDRLGTYLRSSCLEQPCTEAVTSGLGAPWSEKDSGLFAAVIA